MLRTLISVIPDPMKVLFIMMVGLCLIVGAISLKKALRWLGYMVFVLITAPFSPVILRMLPSWLVCVVALIVAWRTFRAIAEALLGRAGASHMMGILAADVVRALFRWSLALVSLPFADAPHRLASGPLSTHGAILEEHP